MTSDEQDWAFDNTTTGDNQLVNHARQIVGFPISSRQQIGLVGWPGKAGFTLRCRSGLSSASSPSSLSRSAIEGLTFTGGSGSCAASAPDVGEVFGSGFGL
jgi:hypothetical protein